MVEDDPLRGYDLTDFGLESMADCGARLRRLGEGAATMEDVAGHIVRFLRDALLGGPERRPACVLARLYKTHEYSRLPGELRRFVLGVAADQPPESTRCLVLLGTAGDEAEWNDRRTSRGHQAIPLVSKPSLERAPMIAALFQQLGVDVESLLFPGDSGPTDPTQRTFNVFFVPEAARSPLIPARDFVERHGVRSVLGFGGLLSDSSLFAVTLFCRLPVPEATAEMFGSLALSVRLALLGLEDRVFADGPGATGSPEVLTVARCKTATLEQILEVEESITRRQTSRLEQERERLSQSVAESGALFEAVLDGLLTIDGCGTVLNMNRAAEKMFGYTSAELVGSNVSLLMPEPYRSEHDGYLRRYEQTGERRVIGIGREVLGRRKDGSTFPVELSVSEFETSGQRRFAGLIRDITERKEIDRMKSEFISTISHELRTPLTSIRGSLGLLMGGLGGEVSEKGRPLLDIALKNCERLVRLINDILDVEKISSGKMAFEIRPLELEPVLEQAIEANRGYASQYGVRLELEPGLPRVQVMADPDRLLQILANFLSNAVKFSPADESVVLGCELRDSLARISVADRGAGIPAAFREKVFQRFAQADSSDARAKGGTGLGLHIVKAIAERLDGSAGFHDRDGGGTVFFVDIPVAREQLVTMQGAAGLPRILHVEDDAHILQVTAQILAGTCRVEAAQSLRAARERLARETFDLVLLDLGMPDGDGSEIIGLVRTSAHPETPIVIFSSLELGARDLDGVAVALVKSKAESTELVETIRRLLPS